MKLLWCDLETSGLDPREDVILELAAGVANLEDPFTLVGPTIEAVLPACFWREPDPNSEGSSHFPCIETPGKLARCVHPKVIEMHTANGLLADCARAYERLPEAWTLEMVEGHLLAMIPEVVDKDADKDSISCLAGSSVHFDLGFLRAHMPRLAKRLSHRVYDVSAVKIFCRSLGMPKLPREEAHRAMADVQESLRHARACATWCAASVPVEERTVAFLMMADGTTQEVRR